MTVELRDKRVFVAGHNGMVGSALLRRLAAEHCTIVTADRRDLDLRRQSDVERWMGQTKPDLVFMAAATVGGIQANAAAPADFIYDNLMIEANIIEAAFRTDVEKLVMLGSTCIYPKMASQPIREETLLSGPLEPTNQWYAIAKIVGIKLCQAYRQQHGCDFIAAQPTNLYGPGDNFDLETGHVIPALMRKAHEAKLIGAPSMTVWGSGRPMREFMHVDDLADALVFLMRRYSGEMPINVGTGIETSIAGLAKLICRTVGFDGQLVFDRAKPDGTPRKLTDVSRLHRLGWRHRIGMKSGIEATYRWYCNKKQSSRAMPARTGTVLDCPKGMMRAPEPPNSNEGVRAR